MIAIVCNGYIVVVGLAADVDLINTAKPNPALPNNILAPFRTDLNPVFGDRFSSMFPALELMSGPSSSGSRCQTMGTVRPIPSRSGSAQYQRQSGRGH